MDVLHYLDEHGADPFQDWLDCLTDLRARLAIYQRVSRLVDGNPGDHKICRSGVWELRVDVGPGYRVYFARPSRETVLVLNGGDKRRQRRDIERAIAYWTDYQRRVKRLRQ